MAINIGKWADHLVTLVFGKMRRLNGQLLYVTAPGSTADDISMAQCKEFNRKADEWLAKRGQATGNWMAQEKRNLQHKSAAAAISKRDKNVSE